MVPTKKRKAMSKTDNVLCTVYRCPNKLCSQHFKSTQGLTNHFLHYSQCHKEFSEATKLFWKQHEQETNVAHTELYIQEDSSDEENSNLINHDDNVDEAAQIVAGFKSAIGDDKYEQLLDLLALLDPAPPTQD